MNINTMMQEFMDMAGKPVGEVTLKDTYQAIQLIQDELNELEGELPLTADQPFKDLPNVAKEFMDIIYIAAQRAYEMGIDVDACLKEVHRSNMSKTFPTELAVYEVKRAETRYDQVNVRAINKTNSVMLDSKTGKVIKPPGYQAAQLNKIWKLGE